MSPLIQKIILATDFSEASREAVCYARWITRSLAAELKILHVFEPGGWTVPSHYYYTPGFEEWVQASIEKTRQKGKEALEVLAESFGINTETIFIEGDTGKEIVRAATRHNTDLLILGTHGYTGWNHLTLGSIAEYVIRHATCPVLTIKPGEANRLEIYNSAALPRDN
jgi:nucleotide-binding universal stress UspA family protein